jgi:hypothetical protein
MRMIVCLAALFATMLKANEVTDRTAIDAVIEAVNNPLQRSRLFTKDLDSTVNFDSLIDLHLASSARVPVPVGAPEPWRNLTEPRIVSGAIRFIKPDVAMVDGASIVRGAVTFADTVPLLFVLKKEQAGWRINAVRRICPGASANRPSVLH